MKKSLSAYKAKRDFTRTREPGAEGSVASKRHAKTFVVQKHRASHLHYDFRLEEGGVLKSWAVPKGPPRKAGDKRLAVRVEDHPLAYGKFHGTIPKGQYGAGTVEIWDRGVYEERGSLMGGLRRGSVKIILHGKKLKGGYALVRFKEPKNWLLIKEKV